MWRRHPITDLVINAYLPMFRDRITAELLGQWLHDNLSLHTEQTKRGQVLMAATIENLTLETVRVMYGLPASGDVE